MLKRQPVALPLTYSHPAAESSSGAGKRSSQEHPGAERRRQGVWRQEEDNFLVSDVSCNMLFQLAIYIGPARAKGGGPLRHGSAAGIRICMLTSLS